MRITEEKDIVFICLTVKEAEQLAEQLVSHVGEKVKPTKIIEKLTNLMAIDFLD